MDGATEQEYSKKLPGSHDDLLDVWRPGAYRIGRPRHSRQLEALFRALS